MVDLCCEIRVFSVPKRGLDESENEDAVAYDARRRWFAVADGATEASYSRDWARLLVKSFWLSTRMKDGFSSIEEFGRVLRALQNRWHKGVPWDRLASRGWLFAEKARQGAFATFLGVRLAGHQWFAVGLGDCNLFILDAAENVRLSRPAQNAAEFGTSPFLVPSTPGPSVDKALGAVWREAGEWKEGERIVVCTDAVAAYLLRAGEEGISVWPTLLAARTLEEFAAWIEQAREVGMRNDDSTMAIASLIVSSAEATDSEPGNNGVASA